MIRWKIKFVLITFCIVLGLISAIALYFISVNPLMTYITLKRAENALTKTISETSYDMVDYSRKYAHLERVAETGESLEGVRGYGLNLLLIDNIQTESYIKELLTLYRDSQHGKLNDHEHHVPLWTLLAVQSNEVGYYDFTNKIPFSYLPYEDKTVIWNKEYKGYPAEAMTLKQLNQKMTSLGIPSHHTNAGSKFKGIFQISTEKYYNRDTVSKLTGYQMSANRYTGDWSYVPDSLAFMDYNYSRMVDVYKVPDDPNIRESLFGGYHNGGEGTLVQQVTMGVNSGTGRVREKFSEFEEFYISAVEPYKKFYEKYDTYGLTQKVERGYGLGLWALIEDGYIPYRNLVTTLRANPTRLGTITSGYNAIYDDSKTSSDILKILESLVKDPWDEIGMSESDFVRIYGNNLGASGLEKGALYKWTGKTSDLYTNKWNGQDPPHLHRTNYEIAGFMWDTYGRGQWIYADLLAYTGVGIDPTNPDDYKTELEEKNEFIPGGSTFGDILKKIGVTDIDPRAYEMLEYGYEASGFYYYYGGGAKMISEDSFAHHNSWKDAFPKSKQILKQMYATKDGTDPLAKAYNRRNDNLVHYGKYAFDCSSFVFYAYNATLRGTGSNLEYTSTQQYSSSKLTTIRNWDEAKAGDIFVRKGHVYFFLVKNTGNSTQTLPTSQTKVEVEMKVKRNQMWVLEAKESGTLVGIRSKSTPSRSTYILRRFKELM